MPSSVRDKKALDSLARALSKNSMTIKQIQTRYRISERTAYRWLDYLGDDEFELVSNRVGQGKTKWSVDNA